LNRSGTPAAELRRVVVTMLRPGSVVMLGGFAAVGRAEAGGTLSMPFLITAFGLLAAWYLNATCLNDLADEPIDRVNLEGSSRPLISGMVTRRQLAVIALAAGLVSLALAWSIGPEVLVLAAGGLVLNVVYSCRPFRLSDRGAAAAAALPLGYVALPYLTGALSVDEGLSTRGVWVLGALYVSTFGRVLLKDFRDVEGDRRFGKAGFLLRRGPKATCAASAAAWTIGTAILLAMQPPGSPMVPAFCILLGCILLALRRLAVNNSRAEQLALVGSVSRAAQAMMLVLLAQLSIEAEGWPLWQNGAVSTLLVATGVWSFAVALPGWASQIPEPALPHGATPAQ